MSRPPPTDAVIPTRRLDHQVVTWSGEDPPIVLIHPNRTSHRIWDFMVAESRLSNRFVAPALRGHAGSAWPEQGYALEAHRDDLVGLLDGPTLSASEGVILVGQATGATLALMIATVRPDRVRAVVAAQPAVGIAASVNDMVRDQVLAQPHFESREAARRALPFSERWSDAVAAHCLDHMLTPVAGGGFAWRYFAPGVCATEAELMRDVAGLIRYEGPVLVFGGAESTVLPPSMFERVAGLLPGARLERLPGANHRLCQDNPAGFARLMDGFVESL